jgi:ribosomal protein L11 methyltransferase
MAALFDAGVQGVHEIAGVFVTQVRGAAAANDLLCASMAASPDARVETEALPDVDWTERWKQGIHVQSLGRLSIAPPWLADVLDPAATIVIDPGMAFGTGEHSTTRGVVRLMQTVVGPGDRVADLGSGSAVLAIAAVKLGASAVAAIEIDPDAIRNAEENVARNGVEKQVHVIEGDASLLLPLVSPVDIILANIISSVLVQLLPIMREALKEDGRAILSGMLITERETMLAAFDACGWRLLAEDQEDAWWSATLVRR